MLRIVGVKKLVLGWFVFLWVIGLFCVDVVCVFIMFGLVIFVYVFNVDFVVSVGWVDELVFVKIDVDVGEGFVYGVEEY